MANTNGDPSAEDMRAIFRGAGEPGPHEPKRMGASPVCVVCGNEHDPFDVDEARALDALRLSWGDVYDVGHEYGRWVASRRDGRGGLLEGATPDELNRQLRSDFGAMP